MGAEQEQSSAKARKRRIERRTKKGVSTRKRHQFEVGCDAYRSKRFRTSPSNDISGCGLEMKIDPCPATHSLKDETEVQPQPIARLVNKYNRYDPGVPMTKDELKQWRKEARRVRNRESAAASRNKTRERIVELESEVTGLKTKYESALHRIAELETLIGKNSQEIRKYSSKIVSPVMSALSFHEASLDAAPLLALSSDTFEVDVVHEEQESDKQKVVKNEWHIIDLMSTPKA